MNKRSRWSSALIHLRMILSYHLLYLLIQVAPEEDPDGTIIIYAVLTATERIKRNRSDPN